MKKNIIIISNLIINVKKMQFLTFNIQEYFKYIIKYIQNIKNRIIFFKSNYYFLKKQKLIRRRKRHVALYSFLSTNLKRN
jgi:hypothetical protein